MTSTNHIDNHLILSLRACKKAFKRIFLFGFVINLLMMFMPIYTMQVLDRVISSSSLETLYMLTIITLSAFLCIAILDLCRNAIMNHVSEWLDEVISPVLLKKSIFMRILNGGNNTGDILRDLSVVKNFITGRSIFVLFDAPWSILYLLLIYMIHPATFALSVFGIIVMIALALWNEKSTQSSIKELSERHLHNIRSIDVANRNADVMEAMGMTDDIVNAWSEKNKELKSLQISVSTKGSVIQSITKFFRMTMQILVIGIGAFIAIKYQRSGGGIIAGSILMGKAMSPFESAIITWKSLVGARISYKKISLMLDKKIERNESMNLPEPKGSLRFENVVFVPSRSNVPTIKNISFAVEPGESVAIVGASSAGKSTIAKMILGIWQPTSGKVLLDGCSTVRWPRALFKQYVGYLPQDIELFNVSIKQNIARMSNNPDPAMVVRAAQIAGIHENILALPNGYESIIGPEGIELSGGQRQRIGIARAFYGNMKLIVLDEPNSNLDQIGEMALINAMQYAKQNNITFLIVTHKLSLLNYVDRVLIMGNGSISAFKKRDEVLQQSNHQLIKIN